MKTFIYLFVYVIIKVIEVKENKKVFLTPNYPEGKNIGVSQNEINKKMKVREIIDKVLSERIIKGYVEVAVYEYSGDECPYCFTLWVNGKDWWVLREGYQNSDWIFEEEAEYYEIAKNEEKIEIDIWLTLMILDEWLEKINKKR